jgi:hypothetical protein
VRLERKDFIIKPSAATPQPKGRMIIWQNNFLIILPNHYSAF